MSAAETSKQATRRTAPRRALETSHPIHRPADEQAEYNAFIRRMHENGSASAVLHGSLTLLYLVLGGLAVWSWTAGLWPVTIVLWLVMGNLGHSKLIAFHESSHGTLNPSYWVNEIQGMVVGVISHVPLSVYRYVHGQHHARICSEGDLELWPFVNTDTPLWGRRLAAFSEIVFGYFYTPFHFLHGVIVGTNIPPGQMRRIYCEYALNIAIWSVVLAVTAAQGWWAELTIALVVPGIISGGLQTIRKYTEHMGMLDCTALGGTRTVVDNGWFGWVISESMLHIDYHGTHHRYAKMPYYHLPEATPAVFEKAGGRHPVFSTYRAAMFAMFHTLGNPRIGSQWLAKEPVPTTMAVAGAADRTRDMT